MDINKYSALPGLARRTTDDILAAFWTGDRTNGHFIHVCDEVLWELGMGIQMLESQYMASGDSALKPLWLAEWEWLKRLFSPSESMTYPDSPYNPACDDSAWSAMTLMSIFRNTGDEQALDYSKLTVRSAFECWKDGSDLSRGLWYRYGEGRDPGVYSYHKSSYCAGLVLSAIEQYIHRPNDAETKRLFDDAFVLYNWVERVLRAGETVVQTGSNKYIRRGLYYTDYVEDYANNISRPAARNSGEMYIGDRGSESALFGNTGFAAINALLYGITGDSAYRLKAVETANTLALPPYNDNGVFLNDRDGWTDSAFMRYFVTYVLPLEGINEELIKLTLDSGLSIANNCRTEEGLYLPDWNGATKWKNAGNHTVPEDLKTSATTAHMITSAHLCYAELARRENASETPADI